MKLPNTYLFRFSICASGCHHESLKMMLIMDSRARHLMPLQIHDLIVLDTGRAILHEVASLTRRPRFTSIKDTPVWGPLLFVPIMGFTGMGRIKN